MVPDKKKKVADNFEEFLATLSAKKREKIMK
jgi:hypothetical protein